jgi:hypothetical protein
VVLGFELRACATPPVLLFVMDFFQERVLSTICPGWLQTMILLITASWVVRITGVSHRRQTGLYLKSNGKPLKSFQDLCLFFFLAVLVVELRASWYLLGRLLYQLEPLFQSFCVCWLFFEIGSGIMLTGLNCDLFVHLHRAGMTGTYRFTQSLVEMGCLELFALADFEPWSSRSLPRVARITGWSPAWFISFER